MSSLQSNYEFLKSELSGACSQLRNQMKTNAKLILSMILSKKLSIDGERLAQMDAALDLLVSFEALTEWYLQLVNDRSQPDPKLMYSVKRNLYLEYHHLYDLINQVWSPTEFQQIGLLRQFADAVINGLDQDVLQDVKLILKLGTNFKLTRYFYHPHIATLTVPIDVINRPWQWSMIWHELGNLLVFPIHKKPCAILKPEDATRSASAKIITSLKSKVSKFGEHEAALNSVLINASERAKEDPYEKQYKNWLEELIEDAIVILALKEVGWHTLADMLEEYYPDPIKIDETRHPPPYLRLLTARKLLIPLIGEASPELGEVNKRWNDWQNQVLDESFKLIVKDVVEIIDGLRGERSIVKSMLTSNMDPQEFMRKAYQERHNPNFDQVTAFLNEETRAMKPMEDPARIQLVKGLQKALLKRNKSMVNTDKLAQDIAYYNYLDITSDPAKPQYDRVNAEGFYQQMLLPTDETRNKLLVTEADKTTFTALTDQQVTFIVFSVDDPAKCGCRPCCIKESCTRGCARCNC